MQFEMEKSPENLDNYIGKREEVTGQDIQNYRVVKSNKKKKKENQKKKKRKRKLKRKKKKKKKRKRKRKREKGRKSITVTKKEKSIITDHLKTFSNVLKHLKMIEML